MTPAELRTKYERLLADTVPGALLPAHEVYRRVLADLEASVAGETLTVTEAAVRSGYSESQLRRLVRVGRLANVGTDGEVRLYAADLPRKPGHRPTLIAEAVGHVSALGRTPVRR